MNIFVCVKPVPDTESKIKLNGDQSFIDTDQLKWVMNPYDENAVEEAIQLKSKNAESKIVVLGLGPKKRTTDALRTALAMGADEAVLVEGPDFLDPNLTAKALGEAIKKEGFDENSYVFTGKLAIDFNNSSVSQMLAENLNIPHATVVSKYEFDGGKASIEREIEGGAFESIELQGAHLMAANKGLNTPRYASIPGIMKAKKKPLKEMSLSDLGVSEDQSTVRYKEFSLPPEKEPVTMLEGDAAKQTSDLVDLLRNTAKVI